MLAGAGGAFLIAVAPLATPDLTVVRSFIESPEHLRSWALSGLATHLFLYLAAGFLWIAVANRDVSPVKAAQLGLAAPTAFAAFLNITPAKPAFADVDPKATPVSEQSTCKFSPLNALAYGVFAMPLPVGLDFCTKKEEGSSAAAAITSSPTSLSVSDFVSGRLNEDPSLRANWLPELLDTLNTQDNSEATAVNKSIARTLALTDGLTFTPDQLQKLEELKTTPAYKTDPTFSYWTNRAIDRALPQK